MRYRRRGRGRFRRRSFRGRRSRPLRLRVGFRM